MNFNGRLEVAYNNDGTTVTFNYTTPLGSPAAIQLEAPNGVLPQDSLHGVACFIEGAERSNSWYVHQRVRDAHKRALDIHRAVAH